VYQSPYLASLLATELRREMLARADQQRRARQLVALARASRRAGRTERRMRRVLGRALQLRAELEQ
jgi:hypothetical protein